MNVPIMVIMVCMLLVCMSVEAAPNSHPGAQWFPEAGFGLFMHWGIHSVKGLQPSWAMIKDYPYGGDTEWNTPEKYYALAPEFDPQSYDPDKWMAAAAAAGMTYAVLTAKHHDGYCLWPTAYGDLSTKHYLGGRDLLRPYVEACRKHGLKVGLYFSPRDWSYPGYSPDYPDFDYSKKGMPRPSIDPVQAAANFEKFYAYTVGQLRELLSNYGQIDLLWFDGIGWPGVKDMRGKETLAMIRELQPGIVVNNRWAGMGDYDTPEWNLPKGRPEGWWENCIAWNGHWGYNPGRRFQSSAWVLERLVTCRAWGGNLLLNVGPAPDGTMPEGFYERTGELTQWMKHSRQSLIGAGPLEDEKLANVPATRREGVWYLHVLPKHAGPVELAAEAEPASVKLLRTGKRLEVKREGGKLVVVVPEAGRDALDEVVEVRWAEE